MNYLNQFNLQLPQRPWIFFAHQNIKTVQATWKPTENVAVFLDDISTPDLFFFAISNKDNTEWVQVATYPEYSIPKTQWHTITKRSQNTLTYLKNEYFTKERTPTLQVVSQ